MIRLIKYLFSLLVLASLAHVAVAQQLSLIYYQTIAHKNSPILKENENIQRFNLLQNELTLAQFRKPQVNITADYLFAPFFFNNGQFISVTQNPSKDAFGYDAGLTNSGHYQAQLNLGVPLFSKYSTRPFIEQSLLQNKLFQNVNKQLLHDIDKQISDQYIIIYQLQQQLIYLQKIIAVEKDRIDIVRALVSKGLMQQNDYLLLDIELSSRQNDIIQQQLAETSAFGQLNNLCGIIDTAKHKLIEPDISQSALLTQFNFQQKYEIDSMSIVAQQQVFNVKYKPQLLAYGNTGLNAIDPSNFNHNIGLSAGLHLNIPIYDGGQKKTVTKQNILLKENLQQYRNNITISRKNDLYTIQQQVLAEQQSIKLIDAQLAKQETLLLILKDKVPTGQVSVTDYLFAIQAYASANQNRIQVQTNYWLLINQYNYTNW
jgi:outer membrane protein TolC